MENSDIKEILKLDKKLWKIRQNVVKNSSKQNMGNETSSMKIHSLLTAEDLKGDA